VIWFIIFIDSVVYMLPTFHGITLHCPIRVGHSNAFRTQSNSHYYNEKGLCVLSIFYSDYDYDKYFGVVF
jgi:hypothetical protein